MAPLEKSTKGKIIGLFNHFFLFVFVVLGVVDLLCLSYNDNFLSGVLGFVPFF